MPTRIAVCDNNKCDHDFQDQEYGNKMRVFNLMQSKPGQGRCTVCGQLKGVSSAAVTETKKKK